MRLIFKKGEMIERGHRGVNVLIFDENGDPLVVPTIELIITEFRFPGSLDTGQYIQFYRGTECRVFGTSIRNKSLLRGWPVIYCRTDLAI